MTRIIQNPEIDKEFYRIKNGKKISYEKCKIVEVNPKLSGELVFFLIKGRSKQKLKRLYNIDNPYKNWKYFDNKEQMLKSCYYAFCGNVPNFEGTLTEQFKEEIQKLLKTKPQLFI
jgi:hypothetical protein